MLTKEQIKQTCLHLSNKDNRNIYVRKEEKPIYQLIAENDKFLKEIENFQVYDTLDVIWVIKSLNLIANIKSI